MGDAEEHLAGLLVPLLDIGLDGLGERRIARLIALDDLVAGLVDGYDMVVFVQNGHRAMQAWDLKPSIYIRRSSVRRI